MKARKKGTSEWKEYREVYGQYGEFLGLETLGYKETPEEYCKRIGVEFVPGRIYNDLGMYRSAILPLEAFDLWEEPNWDLILMDAAKQFASAILSNPKWLEFFDATCEDTQFRVAYFKKSVIGNAMSYADEFVRELKAITTNE